MAVPSYIPRIRKSSKFGHPPPEPEFLSANNAKIDVPGEISAENRSFANKTPVGCAENQGDNRPPQA
jgi:hypothetical protein